MVVWNTNFWMMIVKVFRDVAAAYIAGSVNSYCKIWMTLYTCYDSVCQISFFVSGQDLIKSYWIPSIISFGTVAPFWAQLNIISIFVHCGPLIYLERKKSIILITQKHFGFGCQYVNHNDHFLRFVRVIFFTGTTDCIRVISTASSIRRSHRNIDVIQRVILRTFFRKT